MDSDPALQFSTDPERQFQCQKQEIEKCDGMSSEEAEMPLDNASGSQRQEILDSAIGDPADASVLHQDVLREPFSRGIPIRPSRSVSTYRSSDHPAKAALNRSKHNKVEKRYRENLSTKFVALGAVLEQGRSQSVSPEPGEEPHHQRRRQSLKKASILEEALLSIRRLQKEKISLERKLQVLQGGLIE